MCICQSCKYSTHSSDLLQQYNWCNWYGKEIREELLKCQEYIDRRSQYSVKRYEFKKTTKQ